MHDVAVILPSFNQLINHSLETMTDFDMMGHKCTLLVGLLSQADFLFCQNTMISIIQYYISGVGLV